MTDRRRDPGAPIVVSAYDLAAALYEHVNRFPRAQRTLLGRTQGAPLGGSGGVGDVEAEEAGQSDGVGEHTTGTP